MSKKRERRWLARIKAGQQQEQKKEQAEEEKPEIKRKERVYYKHYKSLMWITVLMLVFSLGYLFYHNATTGSFINKGISLKGGVTLSVETNKSIDPLILEDHLKSRFPNSDITVRTMAFGGKRTGLSVEIDLKENQTQELLTAVEEVTGNLNKDQYNIDVIGSSLGESFFKETIKSLIFAFIFMAIVVFLYFRVPVPSLAVVLAAFSDIIVTIAIVDMIGIKLSTAGIAAFLMLIGYSVDTDILLSTRVLRRKKGTIYNRIIDAMKTGMTMTVTTLVAVLIAFILARSIILKQIMLILLIGLLVDIINTWIQNAGIIRNYAERKKKKLESKI